MNDKTDVTLKEYLSNSWAEFDESTLITPNKNGEKQNGAIDKSECEIKKENLVEFSKASSISTDELLLAALTLTLNKFNFTSETLIFNKNNVPFAVKFENRQISIREFLEKIHETYSRTLKFDEIINDDNLLLKPEFYYGFNENTNPETEYSNYLNVVENDNAFSLSLFYNDELYTKDFIGLFLSSLEKIIIKIINADLDSTNICDIAIEDENEDIAFEEVEIPFIHKRFERQVAQTPDNVALIAHDATLTYDELNRKANRVANALIKKGVKPKSNILVMLSRDSNLIATLLEF